MNFGKITLDGKRYVLVPQNEFEKMSKAGKSFVLPRVFPDGTMDALEFAETAIAQNIITRRESIGVTQRRLAEVAGIRVEVLNRAERGAVVPSVRTLQKIDAALSKLTPLKNPSKKAPRERVGHAIKS